MPPRKHLKFKELQETWYKKLADAGFKDIEHADGSINSALPFAMRAKDRVFQESLASYANMCATFLNEYNFSSDLEKAIWEYHCEGISIRSISSILRTTGVRSGHSRNYVWCVIKALETVMKNQYLRRLDE